MARYDAPASGTERGDQNPAMSATISKMPLIHAPARSGRRMIRNPINTTPTTMVMLRDNDTPNTLMLSRCTAIAVHADGFDDDRHPGPDTDGQDDADDRDARPKHPRRKPASRGHVAGDVDQRERKQQIPPACG